MEAIRGARIIPRACHSVRGGLGRSMHRHVGEGAQTMPKAGQDGECPGTWSTFRENWPAIFGATALGLAVALLGRWWLTGPDSPGADETVAQASDDAPESEPSALVPSAPVLDDSPPADEIESLAPPAESLPSGWEFAAVADQAQEPVRVVSIEPQDTAAPTGAWLTGRIEEVADEPPLANAARLLDDLPVRR